MIQSRFLALLLLTLSLSANSVCAQTVSKVRGYGSTDTQALDDAKRKAVSRVCGETIVGSTRLQTDTEKRSSLNTKGESSKSLDTKTTASDDSIALTGGLIKSFKVTGGGEENGSRYVEIDAFVTDCKSGETVRNAIDSKAMIAQLAKISSELKSLSTNDGVIKDPKSLAQKYHNARILSQRGEVDLALKAYAEVLNEQLIFADPIQDLTTLAKRVYGSKGSRNFIEKSLSHLKGRPEYSYALLKIGVEPDFNDWSSVKDSVESFSPLALVYLQNLYNFCFGLGGTKINPCMKKLYTLPGLEQTSGKLNEIVKNGENLNYYIDSNRSSVDSEDFAGMFGKNAFSVRW